MTYRSLPNFWARDLYTVPTYVESHVNDNCTPFIIASRNAIMTLLWTNPDPSSSFSEQTIPLDLSQYQLVLILTYGTGSIYKSVIGLVGTRVGVMDNDNTIRYRDFNITSTGIAVGTGCFASAYNGSILVGYDGVAKPYKIYGIKLPTV